MIPAAARGSRMGSNIDPSMKNPWASKSVGPLLSLVEK
ncbi:hypothetical protein NSERUTF1_6297 [Nocardia seriolae]|nr:hypothetical protein NSERUTF1_6297 [Nocardia seriolae]